MSQTQKTKPKLWEPGPPDDRVQMTLRLPPALHKELGEAILGTGRSLNAEIVERLQRSFAQEFLARERPADTEAFAAVFRDELRLALEAIETRIRGDYEAGRVRKRGARGGDMVDDKGEPGS